MPRASGALREKSRLIQYGALRQWGPGASAPRQGESCPVFSWRYPGLSVRKFSWIRWMTILSSDDEEDVEKTIRKLCGIIQPPCSGMALSGGGVEAEIEGPQARQNSPRLRISRTLASTGRRLASRSGFFGWACAGKVAEEGKIRSREHHACTHTVKRTMSLPCEVF